MAVMALLLTSAAGAAESVTTASRDAESAGQASTAGSEAEVDPEIRKFERLEAEVNRSTTRHYTPPEGFGGHSWGEPFTQFTTLNQSPITLQLAYSPGHIILVETICPVGACTFEDAMRTLYQKYTPSGFHLFGEFAVPNQGFRFRSTGVLLYPVTYQYCSGWQGNNGKPPPDIVSKFRLCGVRLVFKSQTAGEINAMADRQLTNYELVLFELIRTYGRPHGYLRRPQVVIETPEGAIGDGRKRPFKTWRWCPPVGEAFVTPCKASIVLGFNPESGNAVVLYSTPDVWDFARTRDEYEPGHDPMYLFLHGRQ